jgi:hypothetical protein
MLSPECEATYQAVSTMLQTTESLNALLPQDPHSRHSKTFIHAP